ncbi:MAG: hypothetical protein ACYSO2_08940, partial [Planctomycetota bacterium]
FGRSRIRAYTADQLTFIPAAISDTAFPASYCAKIHCVLKSPSDSISLVIISPQSSVISL